MYPLWLAGTAGVLRCPVHSNKQSDFNGGWYPVRRKSLTLLSVLPVIAASVLLASCSSPNGPPGPTGTLTGTLQVVGGPPGDGPRTLNGQITLYGSSGHITGISVGANGRFSVPITVGAYAVSGHSPRYEGGTALCHAPGPVTVTAGVKSNVEVDCQAT
jgi:hypothetical protein